MMKFVTDKTRGILGTPDSSELWNEIIPQIPDEVLLKPDFKVLNIACGHCTEAVILANRMIALGIPKDRVQNAFWLLDKYQVFTNTARSRFGFKNVITADFLVWSEENKMKFDLVLGNPPYQHQSDSKGNKMWYRFIRYGSEMLTKDGYMLMLTPTSWVKGGHNIGHWSVLNSLFAEKQLIRADMIGAKSYFSGIGIEIGWWIMKNQSNSASATFVLNDGEFQTEISEDTMLSPNHNKMSNSVINKVLGGDREQALVKSFDNKGITKDESETLTDTFLYPHWIMGSDKTGDLCIRYKKTISRSDLSFRKIVFPIQSRYWNPYFDDAGIAVLSQGFAISVEANDTKEGAYSVFYSKLFKYLCFNLQLLQNGFMKTSMVRKLPKLDLSRIWTDAEIYAHFNLTQEEIGYIESQVKA
jgi:site-specific DNA-methyltransferase (adenine-specific)